MSPIVSRIGYSRGFGTRRGLSTYFLSPSTTSVNEGSSVTFTVITTNVPNGTTLYWTTNTVSGTINANDFVDAATSGSFTITNNSGTIIRNISNDIRLEGSESFQLQIRTSSTSGPIVATSSTVTINDTSVETYAVSPSTTSVDEGSSVTFTVTTTGVPDGTTLYWTTNAVSGTINASDFNDASTSGSFSITSNSGSITRTLANDRTTEGSESFQLQIRTTSTSGTIVATSTTVTINDTSITCQSLSLSAFSTLCPPPDGTHSRNSTPRVDPNAANLVVSIPFWGPNGNTSTSEGIADISATIRGSGSNLSLTNSGNIVTIDTAQFKYYGASASFNYDTLDIPALTGLNGAMTCEFWWRYQGSGAGFGDQSGTIWNTNPGGGYSGPGVGYSKIDNKLYATGTDTAVNEFALVNGTWYHIAFARTGTGAGQTTRLFVNGSVYRSGTGVDTTNHSTAWRLGISNGGYTYGAIGYMQDFRIYNICKYTSNFTITGP